MPGEDEWEQFSEVMSEMGSSDNLRDSLRFAVAGALQAVEHADHAGIILVGGGLGIQAPATSGGVARLGDELQYQLGEGPCLQSIWEKETVQSLDLAKESRWPLWSRRVLDELGIRSVLSLQLSVAHDNLGALSLYSTQPNAFTASDRTVGLGLAAHIAVALSPTHRTSGQRPSMRGAAVVGQAQGMLMHRYEPLPSQAFLVLACAAQCDGTTVKEVAEQLINNVVPRRVAR